MSTGLIYIKEEQDDIEKYGWRRLLRRAVTREKTMKLVKEKEAQNVQNAFLQSEQGTRPSLAESTRPTRTSAQKHSRNDDSGTS